MATPSTNYQFAFNGWLFGANTGIQILEAQGLEDLPSLRVQDDSLGYLDGQLTGRDFLNGRTITLSLLMTYDGTNSAQTNLANLKANLEPQASGVGSLQMQLPNRNLQVINARVRKRAINLDPMYTYGYITATVELFAPDPRIYDNTVKTISLTPASGLGRTYNRVYDMLYNASTGTSGNIGAAANDGNWTTWPKIVLTGPIVNPVVNNSTTGQSLILATTLGGNDTLTIQPQSRSISLSLGGATATPARNLLVNTSSWFGFPPGSTTIGFSATSYTVPGASCTITYQNASI